MSARAARSLALTSAPVAQSRQALAALPAAQDHASAPGQCLTWPAGSDSCAGAGTLDPGWAELTSFATQLTSLNLSQNALAGSLPAAWASKFPRLRVLDLSNNAVTGRSPRPQLSMPFLVPRPLPASTPALRCAQGVRHSLARLPGPVRGTAAQFLSARPCGEAVWAEARRMLQEACRLPGPAARAPT